mmetsp:Transcript_109400/g.310245  ORF Transcript_109400/g.310245 Transcript_109400/m.310245 type:complete len:367 (-) Transcript_109400:138-1238(-)
MPGGVEPLQSLRLHRPGHRTVVQRTFLHVVEEGLTEPLDGVLRRAFSAPPVASSRRHGPPPSRRAEEAEGLDGDLEASQESQGAESQVGREPKTTVAIRSIPCHLTRDELMLHLHARGFAGRYDFLYLPINLATCQSFGYAFVNLVSPEDAERIFAEFDGVSWGQSGGGEAVVSWSSSQGLDLHLERYRNSPIMHESVLDACRPVVLEGGVRVEFPAPTKKVPRLRRLRTRFGAGGRSVSSSLLLPGLSSVPGSTDQEKDGVLASLLAGLKPTTTEASPAAPGQEGVRADTRQLEEFSEGSTQASEGSFGAARRCGCGAPAADQPQLGSMLAQGLLQALPDEGGARPPVAWPESVSHVCRHDRRRP